MSCVCEMAGVCERRQATVSQSMHARCKAGNPQAVDAMIEAIANARQRRPERHERIREANRKRRTTGANRIIRTKYGNKLAEVIARHTGEHVDCSGCDNEIARLNGMTAEQIRADLNNIATGILSRGQTKARTWWQRWACTIAPEFLRGRVTDWILEAIDGPPVVTEEPWGCDTRHLTFHVFPTQHQDSWQWNLRQLAARWSLFNGRKVLGLAIERGKTVQPGQVIDYAASLGMHFDAVIERHNSRILREVVTWRPMLEALGITSMGSREVVFSAHAKGVRHTVREDHIEAWARLMYRSCLDNFAAVEPLLLSHVFAGSFKRYNNFRTPGNHVWHYSGTFYWWRPAEVAKRNWQKVDHKFYGTESWPGHQAARDEAVCLFLDDCADLYDREYWRAEVWPRWSESSWAAVEEPACPIG